MRALLNTVLFIWFVIGVYVGHSSATHGTNPFIPIGSYFVAAVFANVIAFAFRR